MEFVFNAEWKVNAKELKDKFVLIMLVFVVIKNVLMILQEILLE